MLDKITTLLKDFIIYLIPGILICYFGLNIANIFLNSQNTINADTISKNSVLTFIGIIFAFLVGFLFSQIQIIIYFTFLKKSHRKLKAIENTYMTQEIKEELVKQIIKVFNLTTIDKVALYKDPLILYLCLNYVKILSNEESNFYINRSSYLSTFAATTLIPIILGLWSLLLELKLSNLSIILTLSISIILIVLLTVKIINNFHKDWINNIFRQFLILSLQKP